MGIHEMILHKLATQLRSGLILAVLMAFTMPTTAGAGPSQTACDNRNLNQIDKFLACISGADALVHLQALQDIADANGGTRASGTPGYDESVNYVASRLEAAGLIVERQAFEFPSYQENSVSFVVDGTDWGATGRADTMTFSGSGTVSSGNVIAVDLDLGLGNSSTSACEPADFAGLDFSGPGDIALIQRGACSFYQKALNAQNAGAEAIVIFNQGNTESRKVKLEGTLGADAIGVITIPVLDVSYDDGLLVSAASNVSLVVDAIGANVMTENVIAELPGANADNVVMAGAHLDSVQQGPGVQDNGSGSAAILAVALQLANNKKYVPQNTLRFAWWGAEEEGLIGSFEYFTNATFGLLNTPEEVDRIAAYLNFDMIASPNYIYGVYDADQSTFPAPPGVPVPDGSEALEDLFEAYYTIETIPYEDSQFSGRSDYQVFILLDIPASGLFTGAEVIKTDEQAFIWGGSAGDQFDPCYHLACDTFDNVSFEALDINVDAAGYAIYNLASTTEAVNGVPGIEPKGITPDDVTLDGPQGTFLGGGGLEHDHHHGGVPE
jgi:Zn-dependent M28 family amino/carboxypeptidase